MSGLSTLVERGIRTARRIEDDAARRAPEQQSLIDEQRQTRDDRALRRRDTRRDERRQHRENRERDDREEADRKASRYMRGQRGFQMGRAAYRARTGLTIAAALLALQWFVVGAVVATVLAIGLLGAHSGVRSSSAEDVTNFTTLTFIGHAVMVAFGVIAMPLVRNVLDRAVARGEEAVIRLNLVRTMGESIEPTLRTSALKAAAYDNLAKKMRGTARYMLIVLLATAGLTVAADTVGLVIRFTLGGDKDDLGHMLLVWNIAGLGAATAQLVTLAVTFAMYRKASAEAQIASRLGEAVVRQYSSKGTGGTAMDVGLGTTATTPSYLYDTPTTGGGGGANTGISTASRDTERAFDDDDDDYDDDDDEFDRMGLAN